jgi:hypothetical protein
VIGGPEALAVVAVLLVVVAPVLYTFVLVVQRRLRASRRRPPG